MKNSKTVSTTLVMLMVTFLGACSTTTSSIFVEESKTFQEVYKLSPEEKDEHYQAVLDESWAKSGYEDVYLKAGRLVKTTQGEYKITKHWDQLNRTLTTYNGHITSTFGADQQIVLQVMTVEGSPKPLIQVNRITGKSEYVITAANVSTQSTMPREIALRSMGIVASAANGVFAAKIHADSDCGDNCDNITVFNDSLSTSQARAEGRSNTSATINSRCDDCADFD